MDNREFNYNYIKDHKLIVLSTCNENHAPQAALVGFAETENLEIIFGTFINSRKYKNLQHNKKVSVVIGLEGPQTLQYKGEAQELTGKEAEQCQNIMLTKNPKTKKFIEIPEERLFKITPT